jgi:hypothetical protein
VGPIGYIIATGVGNSLGGIFNGVTSLMNGKWSRDLQRQIHDQDRSDATYRFGKDFDLRSRQFAWTQKEAEAAVMRRIQERMEDFLRNQKNRKEDFSFDRLRAVFNGSPDGFWIHDPYAAANPGVKSLRILVQSSEGTPRPVHAAIERDMNSSIQQYDQSGSGHPINFPTGVWTKGAPVGKWVSTELHAWDASIPTLILRVDQAEDGTTFLQADVFGFPMGEVDFKQGIELGRLPANPEETAKVLSLAALAASDMYYLTNYGRAPLLPKMLKEFAPSEDQKSAANDAIAQLVAGYQRSINQILEDTPEAGLCVAMQLAEALVEFPDKSHALKQVKEIEAMTESILQRHPEIVEKLRELYTKLGAADDASRLQKLIEDKKVGGNQRPKLEDYV